MFFNLLEQWSLHIAREHFIAAHLFPLPGPSASVGSLFLILGNTRLLFLVRDRAVEPEDEASTRLGACLGAEGDSLLCLFDRNAINNDDGEVIQLSDEELRDLSPEGESVVRCCIRLTEDAVFSQKQENEATTATSPIRLSKSCKRFIKSVVRATVDMSRATNREGGPATTSTEGGKNSKSNNSLNGNTAGTTTTSWSNIQQYLHQLQDMLVLFEEQHQR